MTLLTDDLRSRLPPLLSQIAADDPMVYARFYLPGTPRNWYVIEGEPRDEGYMFFGFVKGTDDDFAEFRLSELEALRGPNGESVELDAMFTEGKLTDVVPAPEL